MSKLSELISELCPDGVEYKKIGEVANYEQPTEYLVKSTNYDDAYDTPVLTAGQTFVLGYTNETEGIYNASKENPVIIFDDFTGAFKWVDFPFKAKSSAMKMITAKDGTLIRYLYHFMGVLNYSSTEHRRLWISTYSEFEIPIPPLAVQAEIVRILDNFTKLTAELTAELTARKKQYEYYRNAFLAFNDGEYIDKRIGKMIAELCPDGVEYKKIAEICDITRGRVMSKDYIQANLGEYPVYSSQTRNDGELGRISSYDYDGEYLTWTTDGANAGSVFYRNGKFSITNVCGLLKIKQKDIMAKYVYYILQIEAPKYVNEGMGNPKIMSNVMARIVIPIPPLAVQAEIVRILDKFSTLTTSLREGLPAEIAARQKQYEYYRDKLLTFKQKEV